MVLEIPESVCKIYNYLQSKPEILQEPAIYQQVSKFAKKDYLVNPYHYSFFNIKREDVNKKIVPSTNFGIELRSQNNECLVIIGYDFFNKYRDIQNLHLVRQIQGVRREKKESCRLLKELKWERMMLRLLEYLVYRFDFELLGVEPADQNEYYERYLEGTGFYNDSLEEHHNRMNMRYDVTAKRNGFKFDKNSRLYLKNLRS